METMERPDVVEPPLDKQLQMLRTRDRRLAWLAGILAVAVVAMGAWMIFGGDGGQSLTAQQEQMIETVDEALVAWNAGDGAALASLYVQSGYHDNGSTTYTVADGRLENFIAAVHAMNFSVERGDTYVFDNFVVSHDFIPAGSETQQLSIHAMSLDGTKILWHRAP